MKKVKRLFKRLKSCYVKGFTEMYGPALKAGVNPFV
jgi:hypothetical protein